MPVNIEVRRKNRVRPSNTSQAPRLWLSSSRAAQFESKQLMATQFNKRKGMAANPLSRLAPKR
jgi:hypothetical protein